MQTDLVLEARAYMRGEFQDVEIGINEETGTISALRKTLTGSPRRRFPGQVLLPSAVDLHVHFRDPGDPAKEDFRSGTRGAALGGVGTVFDMPNTHPIVDRLSRLHEKEAIVAAKACVDWGLWCTLTPATRSPAELLQSCAGAKLYLAPTSGIEDPGGLPDLKARLEAAQRADRPVALHAETVQGMTPRSLSAHDAARSPEGEVTTIRSVAGLGTRAANVHIAHASTLEAADAARTAGFSFGITPHHLLLSYDEGNLGSRGKVNPPLRSHRRRRALWDAFAAGKVPLLETDHAPHTLEEKDRAFEEAPAGFPGIETSYPLLLFEARRNGVDLARVVDAFAAAPAARMGIRKGRIEVGLPADLVAIDPGRTRKIRGSELASKCGWTPFEGRESFHVLTHFLAGRPIVEDGEFQGRNGQGRKVAIPQAKAA